MGSSVGLRAFHETVHVSVTLACAGRSLSTTTARAQLVGVLGRQRSSRILGHLAAHSSTLAACLGAVEHHLVLRPDSFAIFSTPLADCRTGVTGQMMAG